MPHGVLICSDMGHSLFINLICDAWGNKQQRYATLPFLKIDISHSGPPVEGPLIMWVIMGVLSLVLMHSQP